MTGVIHDRGGADNASPELATGELCVEGDRACADGDLDLLASIAERLAEYVDEPLHCALVDFAGVCHADPGRAIAAWTDVREAVQHHPFGAPP